MKPKEGGLFTDVQDADKIKEIQDKIAGLKGAAKGGVVVTRPTYLPSSGIVVGEHPSWSGKGAYSGGISDGPNEAIIPLHEASEFIDPMGRSVAGAVLNQMAMEGSMMRNGGGGGMSTVPVVMDNSTTIQNNNTTTTIPNPHGQMLPNEGSLFFASG